MRELPEAGGDQPIEKPQDYKPCFAETGAPTLAGAVIHAKRAMASVDSSPGSWVADSTPCVVQRLIQIAGILCGVIQPQQRVTGDAALVRFDLVRPIRLRATVGSLREAVAGRRSNA